MRPIRLQYGAWTVGRAKGADRRPEEAGFGAGQRAIVGLGGGCGDGEVDIRKQVPKVEPTVLADWVCIAVKKGQDLRVSANATPPPTHTRMHACTHAYRAPAPSLTIGQKIKY